MSIESLKLKFNKGTIAPLEQVIITRQEYEAILEVMGELEENAIFLDALAAAGVDNWDGYDIAQDIMSDWGGE